MRSESKKEDNRNDFVGNCVPEISLLSDPENWNFMPGIRNLADLPARKSLVRVGVLIDSGLSGKPVLSNPDDPGPIFPLIIPDGSVPALPMTIPDDPDPEERDLSDPSPDKRTIKTRFGLVVKPVNEQRI
ncbi:hypothetical protein TNIN_482671 [Trichonephila inaurata madagascariensis]|uniref:Uncharacterized protein n=1 Tax=Trichonephila inaurata madagascariensis TaxID=2747483 RepID=A0A8X7CFV1_9ARAC|nr:hypothetical protein TNIN_482671 [Trichonephila inaurata madagascariensis]